MAAKTELEKAQEQDIAAQEAVQATGAAGIVDATVGNPLLNGIPGGTVDDTKALLDNFTTDAGGLKQTPDAPTKGTFRVLHSGFDNWRQGDYLTDADLKPYDTDRLLGLKTIEAVKE